MKPIILVLMFVASTTLAAEPEKPVRIGSGVSGHIHPAACVTNKATVLVLYSQSEARNMRMTRSEDGGKTSPNPCRSRTPRRSSSTRLAHNPGRRPRPAHVEHVVQDGCGKKSRFVQFSISSDDGKSWSEPKSLAKGAAEADSVIRHPSWRSASRGSAADGPPRCSST